MFVIRTKKREELQSYLQYNGVQTIIHYPIPPHKQEGYKEYKELSFPITEQIAEEVLSLPISGVINLDDINQIVKLINLWTD